MLMPEGLSAKQEVFDQFKVKHEKEYADENEEMMRQVHFHHNLRYINAMNRKVLQYTIVLYAMSCLIGFVGF